MILRNMVITDFLVNKLVSPSRRVRIYRILLAGQRWAGLFMVNTAGICGFEVHDGKISRKLCNLACNGAVFHN